MTSNIEEKPKEKALCHTSKRNDQNRKNPEITASYGFTIIITDREVTNCDFTEIRIQNV